MILSHRAMSPVALAVVSLLTLISANAARMEDVHSLRLSDINKKHDGTLTTLDAQAKAQRHAEMLSLEAESSLTLLKSSRDHVGTRYRYQQTFRGIPVHHGTIALSEDSQGKLRALFGHVARELALDLPSTAVTLSATQALSIAKRAALSGKCANTPIKREKAEKVIYIDEQDVARVTYQTMLSVAHPNDPSVPAFVIDANSGAILERWDALEH